MQLVGQTWLNLVTWTCGSWSEGHPAHNLKVKVTILASLRVLFKNLFNFNLEIT